MAKTSDIMKRRKLAEVPSVPSVLRPGMSEIFTDGNLSYRTKWMKNGLYGRTICKWVSYLELNCGVVFW